MYTNDAAIEHNRAKWGVQFEKIVNVRQKMLAVRLWTEYSCR